MEIYSSPCVCLVVFFFFFSLVIYVRKSTKKHRVPPGPWRLPIIGSLHHLIRGLPHHTLRNLAQKYGDVMYLQLGEIPVIVISSPRIAKEVVTTQGVAFANRPDMTISNIISYNKKNIAFSEYGDYWRQMRTICALELLSGKMVKAFSEIRKDEVSILISSIRSMTSGGCKINIQEKIFKYTNSVTCRSAFGKICKNSDHEYFMELVKEVLLLAEGFDLVDLFPSWKLLHKMSSLKSRSMKIHQKLDAIMEDIINEHIIIEDFGGHEDLVHVLLRLKEKAQLQYPITNEHIKAVILDMLIAGSESSSLTIIWAISEMMKNPNIMVKAQNEVRKVFKGKKNYDEQDCEKLTYLKLVIKETLRLHIPGPLLLPRECSEQTNIDGYTIPLKTRVLINAWALGRDVRSWHDPESFIPERFDNSSINFLGNHYEFIPFGAGKRICPGIQFGLANIELPLAQLLYHFNWKLPYGTNPTDLDMTETHGVAVGKQKDLYVVAMDHKEF